MVTIVQLTTEYSCHPSLDTSLRFNSFLEAVQTLRLNLPIIRDVIAKDARIVVALQLQRGADGKFYIKSQEDHYAVQV